MDLPVPCSDFLYMRFLQQGRVIRVARVNTRQGLALALYPTQDSKVFEGEAFHDVDDNSPRTKQNRSSIKDKVWLKLLDGLPHAEVVKGYKQFGSEDYFYGHSLSSRTFRIANDTEEPVTAKQPVTV